MKTVYLKPAAEEVTGLLELAILEISDPASRSDYEYGGEFDW